MGSLCVSVSVSVCADCISQSSNTIKRGMNPIFFQLWVNCRTD